MSGTGGDAGTNTNPFDFDVDFDKVQKRREQYLARKAAERGEPLLSGMDKDGGEDDPDNKNNAIQQPKEGLFSALNFLNKNKNKTGNTNNGGGDSTSQKGGGGGKSSAGSVSFGASTKSANSTVGGGGDGITTTTTVPQQQQAKPVLTEREKKEKEKEAGLVGIFCGKKIIRWPYDDYHEVQKQYYVKLEEEEEQQALAVAAQKAREENKSSGTDSDDSVGDVGDTEAPTAARRGFFGFGGGGREELAAAALAEAQANSAKKDVLLQRPEDPPDIPTAVQGLSLSEFERTAEARAISIVSTWLFDCGLIDELLVHGGMGKSTMRTAQQQYTNNESNVGDTASLGADSKTTQDTSGHYSNPSVKTSEGIEVGQLGHIIEGPSKMDAEIAKLRNGTARQLAMVNTRLNDGVAASGGEVQELVNAVNSTKNDLHRLRELSTYIGGVENDGNISTSGGTTGNSVTTTGTPTPKNNMMARSQAFVLTNYPKLKKAINARRNLARCFRELDFYSQIPVTCDRLREELHQAEWTELEWNSLREVSCEHVELEIFLVEAEAAMKVRIDEEYHEQQQQHQTSKGDKNNDGLDTSRRSHLLRSSSKKAGGGMNTVLSGVGTASSMMNYEEVDNFLHEHVKNVWELGDEIRMRIMSGIGSAFELGTNNPAGLVALVEAVEVYETANEEYKTVHGEEAGSTADQGSSSTKKGGSGANNTMNESSGLTSNSTMQKLRFTDMRASALKQMYQDFELRGLEVFREVHEVAQARGIEIGDEIEQEEATEYFNAILRAANELTAEIAFVQTQMAPCFPPNWALEMLWSTCVAHVCSKQILEQIGGTEGHKLPDLTVTQLLDLVAWIESFRSTIEDTFPNIGAHISQKTYFNKRPDLLQEVTTNRSGIDMEVAKDSLAWANNMLWEVHDLAKDEFLFRTKEQTNEWLDNVYDADHTKDQSIEGRLTTSLCEDVYALAGVQLRTIQERLTRRSEALVQAVGVIFKNLYEKQIACRNNFLVDFERCCAASNDFIRMSEHCEEILADLLDESNLSENATNQLDEQSGVLLGLYSNDAVFAAQKVHIYIFEPIDEAISEELFGEEWLNELTANELTLTMVKTLEDFMEDLEVFLDDLMVGKTLDALVTATVIFYLKYFLRKVATHKDNKRPMWSDNRRALERMRGDIDTMKGYFEDLMEVYPALKRAVPEQFEILETFHELLSIAAGLSQSSDRDFVILLQKRIRNIPITKLVVGDIWHAMNPTAEKDIYEKIDVMEQELTAVAPDDAAAFDVALARQTVPGLRLDQELARLCDGNKRNRPGYNRTAAEQGNVMLSKWRETWQNLVEEAKE